jgi:hypothetical protein
MAFLKKKKTMAAMPLKGAKQSTKPNMATNMPVSTLSPTQTAELATMVADNVGTVMGSKRPKFSKKKKIV